MLKKLFFSLFALLDSNAAIQAEPSWRGYDPNAPDLGLPEGNEVLTGLIIAAIAIPLGYAILNANNKNNNGSDENSFLGGARHVVYWRWNCLLIAISRMVVFDTLCDIGNRFL